jgi:hypothetical protein
MEFKILGPLQVLDGDRTVAVGGVRQREMLVLLLVHAHEVLTSDRAAAEIESTISMDDNFGSVRFNLADEVVVQWVPDEHQEVVFTRMRDAVQDLARFAQRAAQAYLDSRPPGTFSVD